MANANDEIWLPVSGYEGAYEVSDRGRVRSVTREVNNGRGRIRVATGRVLSPFLGGAYVKVRLKVDGVGSTKNVHALVAGAFLGPRPAGMQVCHGNGDPHDNRLENLRYDTASANNYDKRRHGTAFRRRLADTCFRGHDFDEVGFYFAKDGGKKVCLGCDRERHRRRNADKPPVCKRGHDLDATRSDGRRFCAICARLAWAIHKGEVA